MRIHGNLNHKVAATLRAANVDVEVGCSLDLAEPGKVPDHGAGGDIAVYARWLDDAGNPPISKRIDKGLLSFGVTRCTVVEGTLHVIIRVEVSKTLDRRRMYR